MRKKESGNRFLKMVKTESFIPRWRNWQARSMYFSSESRRIVYKEDVQMESSVRDFFIA